MNDFDDVIKRSYIMTLYNLLTGYIYVCVCVCECECEQI